jgi:ABC-2 type transport system ATP-binding protein
MLIEAKNIFFSYQPIFKNPVEVLFDLSFSINSGEVVGLLGHNGAGKTTLLRVILGLAHISRGNLKVFNIDPKIQRQQITTQTGVLLDGQRLLPSRWTPMDVLIYYSIFYNIPISQRNKKILDLLSIFGLERKKNHLISSLSRGMKQKLAICVSLIHDPKLLILDEPTIGLDIESTNEMIKIIKEMKERLQCTIIISSHQMNFINAISERILVIQEGKLIFDDRLQKLTETVGKGLIRLKFEPHLIFLNSQYDFLMTETGDVLCKSDLANLQELFSIAKSQNSELLGIEQMFDFESAFQALTVKK